MPEALFNCSVREHRNCFRSLTRGWSGLLLYTLQVLAGVVLSLAAFAVFLTSTADFVRDETPSLILPSLHRRWSRYSSGKVHKELMGQNGRLSSRRWFSVKISNSSLLSVCACEQEEFRRCPESSGSIISLIRLVGQGAQSEEASPSFFATEEAVHAVASREAKR